MRKSIKEQQKQLLKQAMTHLALQLELQEGRRFNVNHGSAEVIKVVKFSLQSEDQHVKQALQKTVNIMTPTQKAFFTKQGLSLENHSAPANTDPEKAGKKKIIYRGQVKWV